MKFAPKELCEKLTKMGCKSQSWFNWTVYNEPVCCKDATFTMLYDGGSIPAFILEDFVGCTEQAKENAKIVWGDIKQFYCPVCEQTTPNYDSPIFESEEECHDYKTWYYYRHLIIDSADWVKYLEETMRKE